MFSCCIIGNTSLATRCAEYLLSKKHKIISVCSDESELLEWAALKDSNGILRCNNLSEFKQSMLDEPPAYLLSIVNPHILSKDLLSIPKYISINYHDALLPAYAGVHATSWAILNDEIRHGISWHIMTPEVDDGALLKQRAVKVDQDDTTLSLNMKCYEVAFLSFQELVSDLSHHTYYPLSQNLDRRSYYGYHDIAPNAGFIDGNRTAEEIFRIYRALYFGHYENRLGIIKFIFNRVIYTFEHLIVTEVKSTRPPGTIVKIECGVVYIATRTYDIGISEISTVLGEAIQASDLPSVLLPNDLPQKIHVVDPGAAKALMTYVKYIISEENYWVKQIQAAQPIRYESANRKEPSSSGNTITLPTSSALSNKLQHGLKTQFTPQEFIYAICIAYFHCCDLNKGNTVGIFAPCHGIPEEYQYCFAPYFPLIVDINEKTTLRSLLSQIQRGCHTLSKYQPFMKDIMLRYPKLRNLGNKTGLIEPNIIFSYSKNRDNVNFKKQQLCILINEDKGEIDFIANSSLVDVNELQAIANRIAYLLESIGDYIDHSIYTLPLLTESEKEEVSEKISLDENPSLQDVVTIFLRQVDIAPQRIAIIEGERRYAYQELDQRSDSVAHYIVDKGHSLENIGLYIHQSADAIIAMLGILKAGCTYVCIDQKYPKHLISHVLEDCHVRLLLSDSDPSLKEGKTLIDVRSIKEILHYREGRLTSIKRTIHDLAYITYTSGSTGIPKGVKITDQGVVRLVKAQNYLTIHDTDVFSQIANFSFDAVTLEIWGALLNGASIKVINQPEILTNLDRLAHELNQCSISFLTTALFNSLIRHAPQAFQSLRYLLFGGETAQVKLINQLLHYKKQHHYNRLHLIHVYGPTENTTFSTYYKVSKLCEQQRIPIGKPIRYTQSVVVNSYLQLLPQGIAGELLLSGAGLSTGYVNLPQLTNKHFIMCAFTTEEKKWYRTGDLVRLLPDRNIDFICRLDNQVKLRGFRIELTAIESVIALYPAVTQGVVQLRKDKDRAPYLVAYLLIKKEESRGFSLETLKRFLAQRLPVYMIPSVFIALDEFPLTPNKKIDFKRLPKPHYHSASTALPSNKIEALLLKVWREVFSREEISVKDNYFDLGGDSIMSMEIIAKAQDYNLSFTHADLFKHQNIFKLAKVVQSEIKQKKEVSDKKAEFPLTPIQRWAFQQQLQNVHAFTQNAVLYFNEPVEEPILEQALNTVIRQHEIFKLTFKKNNRGQWMQHVAKDFPTLQLKLECNSDFLKTHPSSLHDLEKAHLYALQQEINIGKLPLIVAKCIKKDNKDILLLTAHHLIVDGVSWRILLEELEHAYQQLFHQEVPLLPLEGTSYQQWQSLLNDYAKTASFKAASLYWKHANIRPFYIPYDHPAENNIERYAMNKKKVLPQATTEALLQVLPKQYSMTVQEILLGALFFCFYKNSGETTLSLHLEGHGRDIFDECNLYRTAGWFTSIYPLQITVEKKRGTLTDVLEITQRSLHEAQKYGGLYLIESATQSERLNGRGQGSPTISFNFLGHFNRWCRKSDLFNLDQNTLRFMSDPNNKRAHLIDITCWVIAGKLHIEWRYSQKHYRHRTINKLMLHYVKLLDAMIEQGQAYYLKKTAIDSDIYSTTLQDKLHKIKYPIEQVLPLLPAQKALLFYYLYHPGSDCYLTQVYWHDHHAIDIKRMEAAWRFLIKRHALLRVQFIWDSLLEPVQVVLKNVAFSIKVIDLSGKESVNQALNDFLKKDRKTLFDLSKPLPMRVTLFRVSSNRYIFLWTHHHILIDGWSMSNIITELYQHYHAQDEMALLPSLPEASAYLTWAKQNDRKKIRSFWLTYLAGYERQVPSFIASQKEAGSVSVFQQIQYQLDPQLSQGLKVFSKQYRLFLNSVMQFAWAFLISRYSRTLDQVIGMVVSTRPNGIASINNQVGLLMNTLPFRLQLNESQSVVEHIRHVQSDVLRITENSCSSLMDIYEWLNQTSTSSLFDVLFVFENYPVHQSELSVTELTVREFAHYPLSVTVYPMDQITCVLNYNADLLDQATVQRLFVRYQIILQNILLHATQAIHKLPLLATNESELFLQHYNRTYKKYPYDCVVSAFYETVEKHANKKAIIEKDKTAWTYTQLNKVTNQLAYALQRLGVQKGTLVGIQMPLSADAMIGILGILKAGGVYVPIDPNCPMERTIRIINCTKLSTLLVNTNGHKQYKTLGTGTYKFPKVYDLGKLIQEAKSGNSNNLSTLPRGEDLIYVIHTSGSTGIPKGVAIRHLAVANVIQSVFNTLDIDSDKHFMALTPLTFDIHALEVLGSLMMGFTLSLPSPDALKQPKQLIDDIDRAQPNVIQATPTVWLMLLQAGWKPAHQLTLLCGGEPLSVALAKRLLNDPIVLWNVYGPTETTVWSTMKHITSVDDTLSIGKPLSNTQVYVLDDFGQPVPPYLPGELYIAGKGLAVGYWNDATQTKKRFVEKNIQGLIQKMFRTGDLVYWNCNGELVYLDRLDNQVKLHGYRIELSEIQTFLLTYPGISQAEVLLIDTDSGRKLVAFYVGKLVSCKNNKKIRTILREHLRVHLPEYMVPSVYIQLDALPRTSNDKIDKRNLCQVFLSKKLRHLKSRVRKPIEKLIIEMYQDLLKIDPVHLDDDFFTCGGDSLLTLSLLHRLHETFAYQCDVVDILKAPTPRKLAQLIRKQDQQYVVRTLQSPVVPLRTGGSHHPLFLVHPIGGTVFWFASLTKHISNNWPVYGILDPGLLTQKIMFSRLEQMAAYYITEIRKVQKQGPYYLGGASFGATVALEMAHQLQQAGASVRFVGLLDGWAYYPKLVTTREFIEENMLRQHRDFHDKLHIPKKDLRPFIDLHWQRAHLLHYYQVKPTDLPLTLFKAEKTIEVLKSIESPSNQWELYCSSLQIMTVPGDHESMFYNPYVKYLGAAITQALEKTQQGNESGLSTREISDLI